MRLFVALDLPDNVAVQLTQMQGGVTGARWCSRQQLHLTLRFIGNADARETAAIGDALAVVRHQHFQLEIQGVGTFGAAVPRELWAGISPNDALTAVQRRIDEVLQRVGLAPERRTFTPHVTLARLKAAPRDMVREFLASHARHASGPFEVGAFVLYSSELTPRGSVYERQRTYPLLV